MSKPQLLEDEIGRHLAKAQASGELRAAPSYGKPLAPDAGWEQTPDEFRMGFKVMKDAGLVPPEVELFRQRAGLREALEHERDAGARKQLQQQLADLEQKIALRLEALRASGSL